MNVNDIRDSGLTTNQHNTNITAMAENIIRNTSIGLSEFPASDINNDTPSRIVINI